MALASDYWEVVYDALCNISVYDVVSEPEKEVGCTTKFLINFKVVIRRITSSDADRLPNLDDVISRTSVTETSMKLDSSNPNEAAAVSDALRKLKVPLSKRDHMAQRIMHKACSELENKNESKGRRKTVHISVYIDVIVIDDGDDNSDDEDNIVVCCLEGSHPYPDSSMVKQLQKTGVCLRCDQDRKVFLGEDDLYSISLSSQ